MMAVGCDLVDWRHLLPVEPRRREKYLEKAFTPGERLSISCDKSAAVFWAAKECAYKVLFKQGFCHAFSPSLFHCENTQPCPPDSQFQNTISVTYKNHSVQVLIGESEHLVYAAGSEKASESTRYIISLQNSRLLSTAGEDARCVLNEIISSISGRHDVKYTRDHPEFKYPILEKEAFIYANDVSMSHDGDNLLMVVLKSKHT